MPVNQKGREIRMDKNGKGVSGTVSDEINSDTKLYELKTLSGDESNNSIYNLLFKNIDMENIKNETDNSRD